MPIFEHRGATPRIDPGAYVAPTAVISGAVIIGAGTRILHLAVITAEDGPVRIGTDVVVMEHALVRGRAGYPCVIGDAVMIGPHSHVNGATVGDGAFLATGCSIFPGARIGDGAEVRINAVVQVNTTLASGAVVPIGWVAVGDRMFPADQHDKIWAIQQALDFPGTVYGATRSDTMEDIMRRQSEFYGAHADDTELG